MGIDRRYYRCSSPEWRTYGCHLRPHPSQHLLHSNFRVTRRVSLLHALRRRCVLLVLSSEPQQRSKGRIFHRISERMRMASILLVDELDAGKNEAVAMYLLKNPATKWHSWHVFIVFQIVNWTCCAIVCFGNKFIPLINRIALALSMCGLVATVIVLAVMPKKHASNSQVWLEYHNNTGGWSDGVCFMTGLLNAAFAVGVPDCISHLSEEGIVNILIPWLHTVN